MTRAAMPVVQPAELEAPIINSPFETPRCHWHIARGEPPEKREGRRKASYFFRVPEPPRAAVAAKRSRSS